MRLRLFAWNTFKWWLKTLHKSTDLNGSVIQNPGSLMPNCLASRKITKIKVKKWPNWITFHILTVNIQNPDYPVFKWSFFRHFLGSVFKCKMAAKPFENLTNLSGFQMFWPPFCFSHSKTGQIVRFLNGRRSNGIRKPDHLASGWEWNNWKPERSGFRMLTVYVLLDSVKNEFVIILFSSVYLGVPFNMGKVKNSVF
jgi:hypothetical protein